MRITIATGPFLPVPPAPTCGGVEMLWHGLAEAFAQKGHSVTFLAKAHPGQPMDETNAGVHYIRLLGCRRSGRLPVDLLKDWFYSCQLLRRLPAADILSLNSFWLPVLAQHLTHNRGRLIVNVHRYPKGQLWLYRGVARIATVSRAMQDAIIAECPAMASITRVFPNPVDTGIFTPPVLARNYNGPQTIVFTGRVHPEKGAHLLVAAFAQLAPQHPQVRPGSVSRVDPDGRSRKSASPDYSWPHTNPKRQRGRRRELSSLTLRVSKWLSRNKSTFLRRVDFSPPGRTEVHPTKLFPYSR